MWKNRAPPASGFRIASPSKAAFSGEFSKNRCFMKHGDYSQSAASPRFAKRLHIFAGICALLGMSHPAGALSPDSKFLFPHGRQLCPSNVISRAFQRMQHCLRFFTRNKCLNSLQPSVFPRLPLRLADAFLRSAFPNGLRRMAFRFPDARFLQCAQWLVGALFP